VALKCDVAFGLDGWRNPPVNAIDWMICGDLDSRRLMQGDVALLKSEKRHGI
jgi:hypothetical protein